MWLRAEHRVEPSEHFEALDSVDIGSGPDSSSAPTPGDESKQPEPSVVGDGESPQVSEVEVPGAPGAIEWQNETSAQRIAIELRHIEAEVRRLIEDRDPKRKRKLAGTNRWHELEEDIISWKYSNRMDEPTLHRLSELIARRHHLFKHLRFIASTRPTWNS